MVTLSIELPDGFLEEEVRCGYTVTKQMKEIWAIELDMFHKVRQVCKKYNLPLIGDSGTLLGAIRHNGFIPWDDDMDFSMFRKDYNKLCEVAKDEFKYPYFFQTEYTDPGSLRGHIQIRRTDTTGILKNELGEKSFNQGIFIDIFPMDNVPDDEEALEQFVEDIRRYKDLAYDINYYKRRHPRLNVNSKVPKFFLRTDTYMYFLMEQKAQKYNTVKTTKVATPTFIPENANGRCPAKLFKHTITVPFEFLKMEIPMGYDALLKQYYGNYREYVMGYSDHGGIIFDTSLPYKKYLNGYKRFGGGRKL